MTRYFHPETAAVDPEKAVSQLLEQGYYAVCNDRVANVTCDDLIASSNDALLRLLASLPWPPEGWL